MKIDINKITEEPVTFNVSYDTASLDADVALIHFKRPLDAMLIVSKDDKNLMADVAMDYALEFACARCLQEFNKVFHKNFNVTMPIGNETIIDITPNIREEIMLDFPIKSLCKDDCKGICPVCGQDLNKKECFCKREHSSSIKINL